MTKARRHPRRRLIILLAVCGFLLLGWVAGWILIQPRVVASFAVGRLSTMFGGEATFESAEWIESSRLEIRGFRLRSPGVEGPAGLVARIDSLVVDLALTGLIWGDVLHGVTIDGAMLRLAEDESALWTYNIDKLVAEESGSTGSLPTILVSGLRLETGTYDPARPDSWELSGSAIFSGRAEGDGDEYGFQLSQLGDLPDPMELQGRIDLADDEALVTLTGVTLDQELQAMMPALNVRQAWDEFDLQGSVDVIEATFRRGHLPEIILTLDDVSMVLPPSLGAEDLWAHYHEGQITAVTEDPLLHVYSGDIRFSGNSFHLEKLDGYVVGEGRGDVAEVPYVINLDIGELRGLDSLGADASIGSVLERASFDLRLETSNFRFDHGASADLPTDVADIFELFGVQSCTVNINLHFWREADSPVGKPVDFEGRMNIRDAAGAFKRFPYPLQQLSAEIAFNSEMIYLEDLVSRGSGSSNVAMHGTVAATAQPSVGIKLAASDLPLDAALIDAMPPEARSMMRSLFGRHGATTLVASGGDSSAHEHVGLNLDIQRPEGPDQITTLSGLITFDHLNLTWDGFPYPIELGEGRLDWHGDRLDIENSAGDGPVAMTTSGGGHGTVSGQIVLPETDRPASGALEIVVTGDTISPKLMGAIDTLAPRDADMLDKLGLGGTVDYQGTVKIVPGGSPDYDIYLKLVNGQADPEGGLAAQLGLPGPIWPENFILDEVEATLLITPQRTVIKDLQGHNDVTNLHLEGEIVSGPEPDLSLSLVIDGLPVTDRVIVVFPESERETLLEIWEDWGGGGQVSILLDVSGAQAARIDGLISELRLETSDEHVCRLKEGNISFTRDVVKLDEIELAFDEPGEDAEEWLIDVEGSLERGEGGIDNVMIRTDLARFGSPFLSEIVAVLMPEDTRRTWRDLDLDGWFRGRFDIDTSRDPDWQLWIEPSEVSVTHRGEHIAATFTSARVDMDASGKAQGEVRGSSTIGDFDVVGSAVLDERAQVQVDFDFDGQLGAPGARAILPRAVGETLAEMKWTDGEGTQIREGQLRLVLGDDGEPVSVLVRGDVQTRGAGMDLGIEVRDIDARLEGQYEVLEGKPPTLDVHIDSPTLAAAERPVVGVRGRMSLSDDGSILKVTDVRGTIAEGAISVAAQLAVNPDDPGRSTDDDDWSMELLIANADLLKLFGGEKVAGDENEDAGSEKAQGPAKDGEKPPAEIEGRVYLSLFLGGQFGDALSRRGLGQIRITEALIGEVPVIVGIQQMLHLTVPTLSRPDFVDIGYFVDGEQIVLEEILIESSLGEISPFSMTGKGTFDWSAGEIEAVLYPRGGLLVIDDIIGLFQDQLYAVGISGPVEDPEVGLVPFPGLR